MCHETSKTIEMVGQCPINTTIFQERSLQKMCQLYPSCSGMPLVYHCVNYKDGKLQNAVTKNMKGVYSCVCIRMHVCM